MPNGQAAQLANLRPPFAPGNKHGGVTRSLAIDQAIREVRRWSPRAVAFLGKVMEDKKEATSDRIRAAIALLDKVIPNASVSDGSRMLGMNGANMLRIEIVSPEGTSETITVTPAARTTIEHEAATQE